MSYLSITPFFNFTRMKLTNQQVHSASQAAQITLEPDRRYRPLCHRCGQQAATVHSQGHHRFVRDLNLADTQVWLDIQYRKVWCSGCHGARVEQLGSPGTTDSQRQSVFAAEERRESDGRPTGSVGGDSDLECHAEYRVCAEGSTEVAVLLQRPDEGAARLGGLVCDGRDGQSSFAATVCEAIAIFRLWHFEPCRLSHWHQPTGRGE